MISIEIFRPTLLSIAASTSKVTFMAKWIKWEFLILSNNLTWCHVFSLSNLLGTLMFCSLSSLIGTWMCFLSQVYLAHSCLMLFRGPAPTSLTLSLSRLIKLTLTLSLIHFYLAHYWPLLFLYLEFSWAQICIQQLKFLFNSDFNFNFHS